MAKEKVLTEEEKIRKDRVRFRLFVLLIILDILLVGYLVFEMVSIFHNARSNNSQNTSNVLVLFSFIRGLLL